MNSRFTAAVVVLCILGAGVFHFQQRVHQDRLDASRREQQSKRLADEAAAKLLQQRVADQVKMIGMLSQKLSPKKSSIASQRPASFANTQQRLDEDPRVQVLHAKMRRNAIRFNYGSFFRSQNLSPAQAAAVEDALLQREETQNDATAVMRAKGLSPKDPAIGALVSKAEEDYAKAQIQLLGDTGYKQLKDYERTLQLREMLAGVAGTATARGIDFPSAQAEKLLQIIAATSDSYGHGGWASMEQIDWEVVDAQAQLILSPEQFYAFRNLPSSGYQYTSSRGITQLNATITKAANADRAAAKGGKSTDG